MPFDKVFIFLYKGEKMVSIATLVRELWSREVWNSTKIKKKSKFKIYRNVTLDTWFNVILCSDFKSVVKFKIRTLVREIWQFKDIGLGIWILDWF